MGEESFRTLDAIRDDIDAIDQQLVDLLNRRAALAQEVGRVKGKGQKPYFTPERERQVYDRLFASNRGPLNNPQVEAIFREIISAARAAEKPLVAAYWGPAGTFTHMAAIGTFGTSTSFVPCESIREVFRAIEHEKADYGVVPIENSVAGAVPETLDMFPQTNVKICAEIYLPIRHHLLSRANSLDEIRTVYAGPQPVAQCKRWLKENLPKAAIVEATPTAHAAELASKDSSTAAIANRLAAESLGMPILEENLQDDPSNRTRFLVIGYNLPDKTGNDKTSLMFNLRNQPGELYRALGAFDREGVNLMMIESRPAQRSAFEYIFYCDCMGHRSDTKVQNALETLSGYALETVVLGSYPNAQPAQ